MSNWNFFQNPNKIVLNYAVLKNNAKRKRKPPLFNKFVKSASSKKRQALKRFSEMPTDLNRTRLLKLSQKTSFTVNGAKCSHFSNVFSTCLNKPIKFFKTLIETTVRRSVKTDLKISNEDRDTIKFLTVFADMFNQKFVNSATTVEGPTTHEFKNFF